LGQGPWQALNTPGLLPSNMALPSRGNAHCNKSSLKTVGHHPFGHLFHQLRVIWNGILGSVPGVSGKIHKLTNVDLKIMLHALSSPENNSSNKTYYFLISFPGMR